MDNTAVEQNQFTTTVFIATPKPLTKADRLRDIAEKARARSLAQRYAFQNLKKAEEMAEEGFTEFKDKIMTKEFFKANRAAMAVPEGEDPDEYIGKLYDAQKECYRLMEDEGFKVTYEELGLPSTLDINMDAQTRRIVEETKRFTESVVTVSWG